MKGRADSVAGTDMGIRMPRGSDKTSGHLFCIQDNSCVRGKYRFLVKMKFQGNCNIIERERIHEIRQIFEGVTPD